MSILTNSLVHSAKSTGNAISKGTQNVLSGGALGNTQIYSNGTGGIVIQPGRNSFGDVFHKAATNPIISPVGAAANKITK